MRTTGKPGYTFWSFCDNIIIGCLLEERTFEFVEVKKIHVKPNKIKFGTKIPIICVHLGKNLKKLLSYLKSALLEF